MKYIITYIKILYIRLFRVKLDTKVIPKNTPYCYIPDEEKNKNRPEGDLSYYIKPCPYFVGLKGYKSACLYEGFIGEDMAHWDQCKICSRE